MIGTMATAKVVAITGASAGIGRACAERLATDGAAVVVSARRLEVLQELVHRLIGRGGRAIAVRADVTNPDDMRQLVARSIEAFGRLDVMICNAGIGFHGSLAESTPDVARRLVDVNVLGTIYAARAAYGQFAQQNSGHVIAMSSIAGIRGVAGMSVYSATKAAQIGFIEALRTEFLGTGIRASVVYPVSTPTDFKDAMEREFGHAVSARGPRQPLDEVVEAVMRCINSPTAEVYPYRRSRWLAVAAALAPAWTDRYMLKFDRRRPRPQVPRP
jgi:NADP-dependent 3-hydroxy acid dehydrogenase YdfG